MKWLFFLISLAGLPRQASAQFDTTDYITWSTTRRLTVNDFLIKITRDPTHPSIAHFTLSFNGKRNIWTGRPKYIIYNCFLKSASWIDTTFNVATTLRYQQTLFDLAEIYTRQLRKQLQINIRKVTIKPDYVDKLNAEIMAAMAKRHVQYDLETKYGVDALEQKRWELTIQRELAELEEYALK